MIKEQMYISENLNRNGLVENDIIEFEPFLGRKTSFKLNRTKIDFLSSNLQGRVDSNFSKTLDIISKEKLHFELSQVKTEGINHSVCYRYKLKSLQGGPFQLNGSYVMEGFVERGDECEIGHNKLRFKKALEDKLPSFQDQLLEENMPLIQSKLPILIEGQTGVGKTTLAKKIHEKSSDGPFVHINISAFSQNLIESELFGHVKGAFTGAMNEKKGALRQAHLGTLFIDEIDSLPKELQTKLLLFLDDLTLRPVGGMTSYQVDTRLIIASGRNLKTLVNNDQMRADFYYRISSGEKIKLPSLKDDEKAVYEICRSFSNEKNILISQRLSRFYAQLDWPGNIRQLRSHLEKKLVFSNSRKLDYDERDENLLKSGELSIISKNDEKEEASGATMMSVKYNHALNTYYRCSENYTKTAKRLGISVKSLKNLLGKEVSDLKLVA